MSEKLVSGGSTTWTDYVLSPEGHIVATRTKAGSTITWLYTVVDNLGSTVSMTNGPAIGPATVIERDSYDPWGKRRDPLTGADVACGSITSATTRGYTGHEMLDSQCLINMNARLYDPTLARFQSADDMIPDLHNTQSFNRYAYVNDNPLNATDPTGHSSEEINAGSSDDGGSEECGKSGEPVCQNTGQDGGKTDNTQGESDDDSNGHYHPCWGCSTAGIPLNLLARGTSAPRSVMVDVHGKLVSMFGTPQQLVDQIHGMWNDAASDAEQDCRSGSGDPDPSHIDNIGNTIGDKISGHERSSYFRYDNNTGKLYIVNGDTGDATYIATGYSGAPGYVNSSLDEGEQNLGPIPTGYWTIGSGENGGHMGPNHLPLSPQATTDTFNRSDFYMHGDNIAHPGTASQGCIILDAVTRSAISASGVSTLLVYRASGG